MTNVNAVSGTIRIHADGMNAFRWSFANSGQAEGSSIGGWLADREVLAEFMQACGIPDYKIPSSENTSFVDVRDLDMKTLQDWAKR